MSRLVHRSARAFAVVCANVPVRMFNPIAMPLLLQYFFNNCSKIKKKSLMWPKGSTSMTLLFSNGDFRKELKP